MRVESIALTVASCIVYGDMTKKYGNNQKIISRKDLILCGDRCLGKGLTELASFAYKEAMGMDKVATTEPAQKGGRRTAVSSEGRGHVIPSGLGELGYGT